MTSEIVVMNKLAVALAADSAVTLEFRDKQGVTQKIYNTTDKLFTLSKYHPIGIMTYGNALILGTPWEIIVKKYRAYLGKKCLGSVSEYGQDFLKYLSNFFPPDTQDKYVVFIIQSYFQEIVKELIDKNIKQTLESNEEISVKEIKGIITKIIGEQLKLLEKSNPIPDSSSDLENRVFLDYSDDIDKTIKGVFSQLPFTKRNRDNLHKIAALVVSRQVFNGIGDTGIVIAGYGEDEIFPSANVITINGVVKEIVRHKLEEPMKISSENPATIQAFAQHEMVYSFMEGIDPGLNQMISGILETLVLDYPKMILENLPQILETEKGNELKKLRKIGYKLLKEFNETLLQYRRSIFTNNIMAAVGALPKDELAVMAETLINLTSFKRKVSMDAETVGGPIDVALISKGDGFVWIKRKHYFQPNLNPQFIANYFHDTE